MNGITLPWYHVGNKVRHMNLIALEKYYPDLGIGWDVHKKRNRKFLFKVIVNTFYNNKQKRAADTVRVESVNPSRKDSVIKNKA